MPWRREWQPTPWTEEPGGLYSVGYQRVGHDSVTNIHTRFGTGCRQGRCPQHLISSGQHETTPTPAWLVLEIPALKDCSDSSPLPLLLHAMPSQPVFLSTTLPVPDPASPFSKYSSSRVIPSKLLLTAFYSLTQSHWNRVQGPSQQMVLPLQAWC